MGLVLGVAGGWYRKAGEAEVYELCRKIIASQCGEKLTEILIGFTGNLDAVILDIYGELKEKGHDVKLRLITTDNLLKNGCEIDFNGTEYGRHRTMLKGITTEYIKCDSGSSIDQYIERVRKVFHDADVFIYNSDKRCAGDLIGELVSMWRDLKEKPTIVRDLWLLAESYYYKTL